MQEHTGKRRTARTNRLTDVTDGDGHGWYWDKETSLQTKDGQVKERTESQTEGQKRQDKRFDGNKRQTAKSDKRKKRNLKVFYNPMGLDQGTGSLDMKYIYSGKLARKCLILNIWSLQVYC